MRNNIGHLGRGQRRFRGVLSKPRPGETPFRSLSQACQEDKVRLRITRSDACAYPSIAADANGLADVLESDEEVEQGSGSIASSVFMLHLCIKFVCALLQVIAESPYLLLCVVTLLPAGPDFLVASLKGVDPRRLLAIVRADLNRCGAAKVNGWLILALHGEFDPANGMYRLHFHAVVSGGMVAVVDKLRKLKKYQSKRHDLEKLRTAVDKPIKVSRKPITNLPTTLAYVLQSFWPARSITELGDGLLRKQRKKRRIPSPQHTEVLLWLDQLELKDIVLLMKIHVSQGRLKPTQP